MWKIFYQKGNERIANGYSQNLTHTRRHHEHKI